MQKLLSPILLSILLAVTVRAADPDLTFPTAGGSLPGSQVEFRWTPNDTAVVEWFLTVGKTQGTFEYYSRYIGDPSVRAQTVAGLPVDGSVVWARLFWSRNSQWFWKDYQFTAALPNPPSLSSPTPGSTLGGTSAVFTWADNGTPAEGWSIIGGLNAGGNEIFSSGNLAANVRSFTANNIPQNGQTFWVRLSYLLQGVWRNLDYQYRQNALSLTPTITEPAPGQALASHNFTLKWTPNSTVVNEWWIWIGRTQGASDLLNSQTLPANTRELAITTIPTTVTNFWVRLYHRVTGGQWNFVDYQYVVDPNADANPVILTPVPGTTITSPTVRFTWTPKNNLVTEFWLYLGTTSGGNNIFDSGSLGTATSIEVNNVPNNGTPIYATLNYRVDGVWRNRIHAYSSARLPRMVLPATGTTLVGPSQRFQWDDNGVVANAWSITIGTQAGSNNIYDSGTLLANAREVLARFTANGQNVHARLWWLTGFNWNFVDYVFKTAVPSDPAMRSPTPGTTVVTNATNEVTFEWSRNGATLFGWWLYVGATLGGREYHNSAFLETDVLSRKVGGLPREVPQVFVRLWWLAGINQWKFADYNYRFSAQ